MEKKYKTNGWNDISTTANMFSAIFFQYNQWLTCLLYLRNGLLSVMMQQSCNKADEELADEELAHMKYNLWKIP